ncbi:HAD hydrolase family protein [Erysipelothrix sp. D19-032]
MDPRVNKTLGIQWYLENHGLTMENIVAFGDNDNDVEMIEAAQIGVAVKNATDSVKVLRVCIVILI